MTTLLRGVESRLDELQYLKLGSQPLVYADVGMNDLIPMTQLGQGFVRLFRIFSEVLLSESKIILINEIENGLSYPTQVDLWRGLAANVHNPHIQIFATTHSYECIQAADEVFLENVEYDLALHRLERHQDGQTYVNTYSRNILDTALDLDFAVC